MSRKWMAAVSLVLVSAVFAAALSSCGDTGEGNYRGRYVKLMNEFQKKSQQDEKALDEKVKNNDLSGIINLLRKRLDYVEDVAAQLLALKATKELSKLHIITLYYLLSLKAQLEAQSEYSEALLAEKPTTDLKTELDNEAAKTQLMAKELVVELQKLGITLEGAPKPPGSKPSATQPGASGQ